MSQMTDYMENALAEMIRGQGLTLPTNFYWALGSAGSDGSFTELSGTGYARQAYARSLAKWAGTQLAGSTLASSGTSHETSNNDAVSWGNPGGNWGTANVVGLFDASTGGNCWMIASIAPIVITTGNPNPVSIAAGEIVLSLGSVGGLTDYGANSLIDLIFRAQSWSWPATVYFSLYSAAPSNAGGGTEFSAGGYTRVAMASSRTNWSGTQSVGSTGASSGTGGRISNNITLTFPAPTSPGQGTAVATGIHDAGSSGNLLIWSPLTTSRSIPAGGPAASYGPDKRGITLK